MLIWRYSNRSPRPDSLVPESKKSLIHFALGKALDDVGEYERAFEQWLMGNALIRRELAYDELEQERSFRRIIETFDPKLFERFATAGDSSRVPLFILGMPRSGSTLVEQIIASHPAVHGAGETMYLDAVAKSVTGRDGQSVLYPQYVLRLDDAGVHRLGQAYLAGLPPLPDGKTRVTDKTPGNFWYVGLIRLILPHARIIHTTRDPVDTCVSCFSKLFASGQTYSYDLAELGRYFRWYSELMDHWRAILPAGAMLDVAYEDVVDNLEAQARRLLDFCGLPWDAACLSFHETDRPVSTASSIQVRQPLYRSSVAR